MNTRPRVALVGCGRFACEAHIPALKQLEKDGVIEVVGICSRSDESLARANRMFRGSRIVRYKQLDDVLAVPDVDVVDLVLPIPAMPDAIRKSLRAGKHVISEKPCAPTLEQGLDLLRCHADLEDPPLWAVAENWRFKRSTELIGNLLKGEEIGPIRFADFSYMTHTGPCGLAWRGVPAYSGGILLDSGVHFVALLRQVVGEVTQVTASVSQRLPHLPPADSVSALLSFAGGAEGCFRLSFAGHEGDSRPKLTLTGARGMLTADFGAGTIEILGRGGKRTIRVANDRWVPGGVHPLLVHFMQAVAAGVPLRSNAQEALCDVAVIEAMLASSRTNAPVRPSSLHDMSNEGSHALETYGRVHAFNPSRVVYCASVEEVRSAVSGAVSKGLPVRVMGNGYSWAPHVMTPGVCLRLVGLNRIMSIDLDSKRVRVQAGVRLGDLTRSLAAQGLALPSLSFVADATVGGVIATGSHGTSSKWGTLSDFVVSMTLVLATGEIKTVGPGGTPEELRAAKVAVGMLGVIVEVELQATDMPWVRYSEQTMRLSTFLATRSATCVRYDHVWVHWTLAHDHVKVRRFEVRDTPTRHFRPYVTDDNAYWISRSLAFRAMRKAKTVFKRFAARVITRRADRADQDPAVAPAQVWMSMQYAVPASHAEAAIGCIRTSEFARVHAGRVIELKFLKGTNDTYLGPNAGDDALLFNIWWLVDDGAKFTVFDAFETMMRKLHARPHWGKFHTSPDLDYMRAAYPRWPEFEAVRSRFDPTGIFSIFGRKPVQEARPSKPDTAAAVDSIPRKDSVGNAT